MLCYLISYDIVEDRERYRVSRILEQYGKRVQYSVFEVSVRNRGELDELCQKLRDELADDGTVRVYALCKQCRSSSYDLAGQRIAKFPAVIII